MQALAITAKQCYGERGISDSAEAMVAILTGAHVNLQPVYTLSGMAMDGVRAQTGLHLAEQLNPFENSRLRRALLLNAVRYFVVQQQPGFLYVDMTARDLIDCQLDGHILSTIGESLCSPEKLVIMLTGSVIGVDATRELVQAVAKLRASGINVGVRALTNGDFQLALINIVQPRCLALYAADRCVLPARIVAGLLASLPRMTGKSACPVIADHLGAIAMEQYL